MTHSLLILNCPDHPGIVAKISSFLTSHAANITSAHQYSTDSELGHFFIRIRFCHSDNLELSTLRDLFTPIGAELNASWQFYNCNTRPKLAILVSKPDHCLHELLYQHQSGDLHCDITAVISNHDCHSHLLGHYDIPFHYIPATSDDRKESEILSLVQDQTDVLVLARYMQILSSSFISTYSKNIINIHHSFLPSFKGGNPYQQAFDHGVKLIGATAHYVTPELDEGPIIAQDVTPITHNDTAQSMKTKGKNLEKSVLATAVQLEIEHRVARFNHKTVVWTD